MMQINLRLILAIPLCFTLLVAWFSWSAFRSAPQFAVENLRGAGLSISAAIEQLAVTDTTLRSLARYTTQDIAYFALSDQGGTIRFHTNPALIGSTATTRNLPLPSGISEQRERLGTGEEVYVLRTRIHSGKDELLLVLALHTYRADQIIYRVRTGISVLSTLTAALWVLTVLLVLMLRREEKRRRELLRREELARLGEMAAIMAHEIRNPLSGIKGFAQLAESADTVEQARNHASKIVIQSLRLEELVSDLLAFARDDKRNFIEEDMTRLVRDCVDLIRAETASQHVDVSVAADTPCYIFMAPDRITQMLLNLMKNGIQAMPTGGKLSIYLECRENQMRLRILDIGTGIPASDIPHIFEPFWTSKARGTGLGLALCRKIAEEHGGSLSLEATSENGSEFVVTLPSRNYPKGATCQLPY